MNCNNSVTLEIETSEDEYHISTEDRMARPHIEPVEEQPSCSNQIEDVSFYLLRMLEDSKLYEDKKQAAIQQQTNPGGQPVDTLQDDKNSFGQKIVTEKRASHAPDDGISSISSDSQWKCKTKSQTYELAGAKPKQLSPRCQRSGPYHSPEKVHRPHSGSVSYSSSKSSTPMMKDTSHSSQYTSPRKVHRLHSGTVSYSSSKSSTPMKKDVSYASQNTRSSCKSEGTVCRICHEGDQTEVLISPCYCAGSMGLLHVSCLQRWLGSSNKTSCEICNFQFTVTKKAKPFKEFIKDPGTARDRRNLICDLVSFILITPLTIVTTYLSIAGANKYYKNKAWERGGLIGLSITLWLLYLVWFLAVARHNYRLWRDWVMFHQDVTLTCSPHTGDKTKADSTLSKAGSISTVSSVHLEAIQIKVSGPMGRHRKRSPKQNMSTLAPTGSNLQSADRTNTARVGGTPHHRPKGDDIRLINNQPEQAQHRHHTVDKFSTPKQTGKVHGHYGNQHVPSSYLDQGSIDKGRHNELYKRRCEKENSGGIKQRKFVSPKMEKSETNSVLDKSNVEEGKELDIIVNGNYDGPAAIFSRGNSPEDANTKTASQQYTEEWLDLKTGNSSVESYYTCAETKSVDNNL